jgi:TrpR-related protein YerC/YecD
MKTPRLSKENQEQLLQDFCEALAVLRTPQEVLPFITDLLTKTELTTLLKRLQIARLLLEGREYRTIEQSLRTGHGTIARVASWLAESGEGFRMIVERIPKKQNKNTSSRYEKSEWDKLKRRYPMMFWPQLLLEEVVRSADQKEKERFHKAVESLDRKSRFYQHFNKLLSSSHRKATNSHAT